MNGTVFLFFLFNQNLTALNACLSTYAAFNKTKQSETENFLYFSRAEVNLAL